MVYNVKKFLMEKTLKKTLECANHVRVQHTGTVLYFFFFKSEDDSWCMKSIIICSMYDSCN